MYWVACGFIEDVTVMPAGTVPNLHVTIPLLFSEANPTSFDSPTVTLTVAIAGDTVNGSTGVGAGNIESVKSFEASV